MTSSGFARVGRGLTALTLGVVLSGCSDEDREGGPIVHLRPNGDVLSAGTHVESDDTVPGDVMLAGGDVTFEGATGGSYLGLGGAQHIGGRIDGSVRAVGGTIVVDASVARNVTAAGGRIHIAPGATVDGNAYLAGGAARIDGTVSGDVYVGADEVVVRGRVGGDLRVEASTLLLGPEAYVEGELRYATREEEPSIDPRAVVVGGIEEVERPEADRGAPLWTYILRLLAFITTGVVLLALFPGAARRSVDDLRRSPVAAFGTGLLSLIVIPVAVLVAAISVVGLPVALMVLGVAAAALYVAPALPAIALGEALPSGALERGTDRSRLVLAYLIGGTLLGLLMLLPWIGFIVRTALGLLGLGAMLLALASRIGWPVGTRPSRSSAQAGGDADMSS